MNESEGAVLKLDRLGRVRTAADRRDAILDDFERSGMSGLGFAQATGIKYPTLMSWVQKRRKERVDVPTAISADEPHSTGGSAPVRFMEAVMDPGISNRAGANALGLILPGGVRLEITDPCQLKWAVALIKELTGSIARC